MVLLLLGGGLLLILVVIIVAVVSSITGSGNPIPHGDDEDGNPMI